MNYQNYEFEVFSVKNLDVSCVCQFDWSYFKQETDWSASGWIEGTPTQFKQFKSVRLHCIVYLNGDIRKFNYDLWCSPEQIRDRLTDFLFMFHAFEYDIKLNDTEWFNKVFDVMRRNLCVKDSYREQPLSSGISSGTDITYKMPSNTTTQATSIDTLL